MRSQATMYPAMSFSAIPSLDIVAPHGLHQPNAPIQPAMARPISSGESSWT
jgi:hypothetical protein